MDGWIKLHRKIIDDFIWSSNEPFDKRSAWIDLLLLANHSDNEMMFDGKIITIKRGQLLTSIRHLSERWGWSTKKVGKFLQTLEKDRKLIKESDRKRTVLTIVKYGIYQGEECDEETLRKHRGNTEETQRKHRLPTNKNEKNVKNEKNNIKRIIRDNPKKISGDVERIIDEWNTLQNLGVKPVTKISDGTERYRNLTARIAQYGTDDLIKTIDRIKNSDFLLGRVTDFVITFDWFVKPNNYIKVSEGNYDNKTGGGAQAANSNNVLSEMEKW